MSTLSNAVTAPRGTVLADLFADTRVRNVLLVFGGALFTAICAQITIPMTPVPMTAQTLAVVLVGSALGWKRGAAALLLYAVLGLFLPVFSDFSSGLSVITGATGGYIVGFIFAAAAVGYLAEKGTDRKVLTAFASFIAGQAIIFAFGLIGLKLAAPGLVDAGVMASAGWAEVIHSGFTIFIIGGLVKAAVGAVLMPAAWRLAERS
ncbi:MAG: biotin transporter BioY [Solirubrobacterales bacterium]|nr:biotin transporter BioY [Solirubrobacterales bacterium]